MALRPATQLFIADHGQYRTQPLIVADGAVSVQCRGLDFMCAEASVRKRVDSRPSRAARKSKDTTPVRLADVAVFCDSDDTYTASVSYLAYVRLERRRDGFWLARWLRARGWRRM